jgi:membrane protease YdiL (CAAX protease family)
MFHGILQSHPIPVWSHVIDVFSRMGERLLNANIVGYPALAMANPVKYFLLPLPLLLLFGARFSELGFSRGHHTVSVLALWCIVPAVLLVFQLTFGYLTFGILSRRFIRHFLQNGFGEEFLFRGALQTRLRVLFNSSWAIVIQALIFGIWHFGKHFINLKQVDINSIAATVAFSIAGTAIFGIAYGIIFQRTRNLLACSVIHVVFNSLGG